MKNLENLDKEDARLFLTKKRKYLLFITSCNKYGIKILNDIFKLKNLKFIFPISTNNNNEE